jgi:hydroxymethylbilane synthase
MPLRKSCASTMSSLSLSLRVSGRRAVVVGGGTVALRKCATLLAAGAGVLVIAPTIAARLRALAAQSLAFEERAYRSGDLEGAFLVIAATDDDAVNATVVADARAVQAIVINAGAGERGDASMPATIAVGDITIAVDSGGSAPAFAKRIAREAGEWFGPDYAAAARVMAHARTYAKIALAPEHRSPVMQALANRPVAELSAMTPIDIENEIEDEVEHIVNGDTPPVQTNKVICASRASALAMTQTRMVAAKLALNGIATEICTVTTTGDRVTDRPIAALGSENVFVTELEHALRDGRADYAVHSCKDLPSTLTDGMQLVAITEREDARDAFCSERYASFEELPAGARVGTSSPRRRAQLRALRADLRYDEMRGNVDTRLRKLRDGEYDAIVLAMAGLNRLKTCATHTVAFDADRIVPAAAQGALAVETLAGSSIAGALRAALNHDESERCISAERAALAELHAGCTAPIGVHARANGAQMTIEIAFAIDDPSGVQIERVRETGAVETLAAALALGRSTAARLREALPLAGRTVAVPRTQERASELAAALRRLGANVVEVGSGDTSDGRALDAIAFPSSGSVEAAGAFLASLPNRPTIVAMGPQSTQAARDAGWTPDATAPEATIASLVGLVRSSLEGRMP